MWCLCALLTRPTGLRLGGQGESTSPAWKPTLEMWLHRGQIRHVHIRQMPFTVQVWVVMT